MTRVELPWTPQGLEKRPLWERLGRNIDPTAVAAALESLHVGSAAPVPQGSAAHPPEVGASGSTEAFEQNVGIEQDEDERVQVSAGRAHDESPCKNAAPLLSPGILSAATQDPAVPDRPSESVQRLPTSEFEQRADIMFVVGTSAAAASGREKLLASGQKFTNQEVLRAWKVVEALCKAHGAALLQSFGNFDKYVGTGWLLGDVALGGRVEHGAAHAVGRKVGKLCRDLPGRFAAPLRRVRKAKNLTDEERGFEMRKAEEEEATLRQAEVDLLLHKRLPCRGPEPAPEPEAAPAFAEPEDGVFAPERREAEEQFQRFELYIADAIKDDERVHTAQLEMQQAANRLGAAQRRLKKARAEHLRRAGKRPPPNPSRAMEFDDKGEETQESAAAWEKRMGDWNVRMRLYYELNREAEWELEDARHEEHEASIEAHEADDWYQKSLEWRRSSGRRVA